MVMRGVNDDEMAAFVNLICKTMRVDMRFIELMPFDSNNWSPEKMVSYAEMKDLLSTQVRESSLWK